MRELVQFSTVQQKEMIDANNGRVIGYIIDAEVNVSTGCIEYFLVSTPKKFYQWMKQEQLVKKIYVKDVMIIGKDVIIVNC